MKSRALGAFFLCWLTAVAARASLLVEHAVPAPIEAGSQVTMAVAVTNLGSAPWSPADGFALSYHWLDGDGSILVWDGQRTPLPEALATGSTIELTARVEAPRQPGEVYLQWDVVREGVEWLSETEAELPEPVAVTIFVGRAFSIVGGSVPPVMFASSATTVELVVQNDGVRTWASDGGVAAAYHWLESDSAAVRDEGRGVHWEGRRTPFPAPVRPHQATTLAMVVETPDRAGLWHLQWDLVEEGICWFSERAPGPFPTERVLVVPNPRRNGFWWSFLVLFASALAVVTWRFNGPRVLVALFASGDLAWCVAAVSVKQGIVLDASAGGPTGAGWILTVAGAAAAALVAVVLPGRWRGWGCWLVVAGATLLIWADAVYLRFFGDLPSASALAGAGQLARVGASVRALLEPADLWLWLDLLPGALLVLVAARLRRALGQRPAHCAVAGLVAMVSLGGFAAIYHALAPPDLLAQVFRREAVAREVGLLNLHAIDVAGSFARHVVSTEIDADRLAEVVDWFRDTTPQRAGVGSSFAAAAGFNLVMVQVESLQGFVIGFEVGDEEVTPFLNSWAEEALWFSNLTDQTGQGRSSDSELATQVSLLPLAGGAAAFRYANNDFTGIAEILAEHGYRTLSAVPYDGAFWNRRETHAAYGFQESFFEDAFEGGERVGWGLSDRDFLEQAARRLTTGEKPLAAYLLTLSLHHPFDGFPGHLVELDVGTWDNTPFGNYLHTMHFFDASLAAFIAKLERLGLADDTVVAIWGDHDAGFRWRPEIAAVMGATPDPAGWYLSQEVPLLIKVPGAGLHAECRLPAGHADVAPTLLALLGIDPGPYAFIGRNLLGEPGGLPVVGEYGCWRDSSHLFLQGAGDLEDGPCIDIATMARVQPAECREGFFAARRMEEISALVLDHDLQRMIHHELVADPGAAR